MGEPPRLPASASKFVLSRVERFGALMPAREQLRRTVPL
ncbi:hypothetical protein RISK_001580 [Rhodopirellula islandica]|uniref:Uncharacterized protein n=1 Tax=Rhodopirellula islandica TaxID=595434 RepID=A0A0J1ELG0_RHOIS|nr:hypothetical protein RISK_001580 [Rhodopirellula islandica]